MIDLLIFFDKVRVQSLIINELQYLLFYLNMNASKFSFSSTFNWEDANLRALLHPIPFYIQQ